jgi:hypothetical protein
MEKFRVSNIQLRSRKGKKISKEFMVSHLLIFKNRKRAVNSGEIKVKGNQAKSALVGRLVGEPIGTKKKQQNRVNLCFWTHFTKLYLHAKRKKKLLAQKKN